MAKLTKVSCGHGREYEVGGTGGRVWYGRGVVVSPADRLSANGE